MEDIEALEYSANLEFEVSKNGTTKVREYKIAENHSDSNITIESYSDILLNEVVIDSLKCYRLHGTKNINLDYKITEIPGTNRRRLSISDHNTSTLRLYPGVNNFVIEHHWPCFYFTRSKIYAFYFHHSLPKTKYFKNHIVPKTIKCKIEKPFSRIFYSYELSSIHPPIDYDEADQKSFSKDIVLTFKFNLSEESHYFNTIIVTKKIRLIGLLGPALKFIWKYLKTHLGGASA